MRQVVFCHSASYQRRAHERWLSGHEHFVESDTGTCWSLVRRRNYAIAQVRSQMASWSLSALFRKVCSARSRPRDGLRTILGGARYRERFSRDSVIPAPGPSNIRAIRVRACTSYALSVLRCGIRGAACATTRLNRSWVPVLAGSHHQPLPTQTPTTPGQSSSHI